MRPASSPGGAAELACALECSWTDAEHEANAIERIATEGVRSAADLELSKSLAALVRAHISYQRMGARRAN